MSHELIDYLTDQELRPSHDQDELLDMYSREKTHRRSVIRDIQKPEARRRASDAREQRLLEGFWR